jgi:hypothetical protein
MMLVERFGYVVREYRITGEGQCPVCQTPIPGLWSKDGAAEVRAGNPPWDQGGRKSRRVEID